MVGVDPGDNLAINGGRNPVLTALLLGVLLVQVVMGVDVAAGVDLRLGDTSITLLLLLDDVIDGEAGQLQGSTAKESELCGQQVDGARRG